MKRERRAASICDCGSSAFVRSTRGATAIVDASDFAALSKWQWSSSAAGHIYRREPKSKGARVVFLHHEILQRVEGLEVDHINGNPADNRRVNLRYATKAQNQMNRHRVVAACGFKGVTKNKARWMASIKQTLGGRKLRHHLGTFDTAHEAARAYDAAALRLFGEFASPNFKQPDLV